MQNRLKFICFYKVSTLKMVNCHCNEKTGEETFKTESAKVCNQIKNIGLGASERQKINTSNGSWFCTVDDKDIMYLSLTVTNYPERHAYALAAALQQELEQLEDYANMNEASLKLNTKKPIKDLAEKYNDLESIDKIYQAQQQVDETKIVMEDNVKKMLANQQNLDTLSVKADKLNSNAQGFYKNSSELASIMYWRNMKLKIIIGLIVLSAACYIAVPIIIKIAAS